MNSFQQKQIAYQQMGKKKKLIGHHKAKPVLLSEYNDPRKYSKPLHCGLPLANTALGTVAWTEPGAPWLDGWGGLLTEELLVPVGTRQN